jgi:tetratricopeptide (TPR) repeat protein
MKPGTLLLWACAVLFGTSAAALGQAAAPTDLVLEQPKSGQTYRGTVNCIGVITGYPEDKPVTVRIIAFGMTHHIQVKAQKLWRGGRQLTEMRVTDGWFPFSAGEQKMQVLVFVGSAAEPAVRKEVAFKLEPALPKDIQDRVEEARKSLREASELDGREREYEVAAYLAGRKAKLPTPIETMADTLYAARVQELGGRVSAYCNLRWAYEWQFDRERALGCLTKAQQIWGAESAELQHPIKGRVGLRGYSALINAPAHFRGLSSFYAAYGNLDEAVRWMEREAAFYQEQFDRGQLKPDQQRTALYGAANAWDQIAYLHLYLRNDIKLHKQFTDTAEDVRAKAKAVPAN